MSRLQLTFDTLANSPIDAAVDLLIAALEDEDVDIRDRALRTLIRRGDAHAAASIVRHWDRLNAQDIELLKSQKQIFADPVEERIRAGGDGVIQAIIAARHLQLNSSLQSMITIAESSESQQVRQLAGETVLVLVSELGFRARANRDQQTVRGPVLARLADSLKNYSTHESARLVEAYLAVSAWSDGELRTRLEKPTAVRELICAQLETTDQLGPIDLLAGFVKRRELPPCIARIIQGRDDRQFRDSLLFHIGSEPGAAAIRNLQNIGLPRCCRGGERLVAEVDVDQLSALIHLYVAASQDTVEKLQVIAAAASRDSQACMSAAAIGFAQSGTPEAEYWMRAAIPVADENQEAISRSESARLLSRLIDLLEHSDGGLVRSVRQVLSPLFADNIAPRLGGLRLRSRRKLGQIISIIDPDAISRVRDALRHPVLANRLHAIEMADALAAADQLPDALEHIIREDHHDARIRVAEMLAKGTDDVTLRLLEDMTRLPDCRVRDAALAAIATRQSAAAS